MNLLRKFEFSSCLRSFKNALLPVKRQINSWQLCSKNSWILLSFLFRLFYISLESNIHQPVAKIFDSIYSSIQATNFSEQIIFKLTSCFCGDLFLEKEKLRLFWVAKWGEGGKLFKTGREGPSVFSSTRTTSFTPWKGLLSALKMMCRQLPKESGERIKFKLAAVPG